MEFEPSAIELAIKDSQENCAALVAFAGNPILPDEGNICEHFIIRRDFIPRLDNEQIFSTDFHHTCCDNWLWEQAKRLGQAYKSNRAKIRHNHFSVTGKMDSVYERGWSNRELDKEILRKKMRSRPKIAVYTITKNEEKFIKRYCESAADADYIVVVDTGSTDDTLGVARDCGAIVHEVNVIPWRFDVARNASLALLPADADVCVAADADEVLTPGWRDEIERVWTKDATRLRYLYDWGSNISFMCDKIHSRRGYSWRHPCHERLVADPRIVEKYVETDKLIIVHRPDETKSRGQYLDLLSVGVKEDPHDPRNSFYYARELTFYGKHAEATVELQRYLSLPGSTWAEERAFAMRLLGDSAEALGRRDEALSWYRKGTHEASHRKEPWLALSEACYRRSLWEECRYAARQCLSAQPSTSWPTDAKAESYHPHDMLAISSFWLGDLAAARASGQRACDIAPSDERLRSNMRWYQETPGA